eukprot:CAMPEP_0119467780 /NCGR_PEP_ID=MMETSP1344-20130328/1812_1 /TAXON_ID=236787 /ORGANISM="Florenciella parvula, Strain CCMP2471" /LENGTH=143 /DNA_ID=CAMNT_0007500177 /DNA_START=221 /DNA_END=649 /DNA_ORIENTATION=+
MRVYVRIRPSTSFDRDKDVAVLSTGMNTLICASDHATSMGCNAVPEGQYVYDAVFGPEHTNKQVFALTASPLVSAVLAGTNACLFAYGQTGAGKTYSMVGPNGGQGKATGRGGGHGEETQGCLPLAAAELFRKIANVEAGGTG